MLPRVNLTLIGRSSSHFTRVTRMLAHELDLEHDFRPVFDLTTLDAAAYGGNPALKIPVLLDDAGPLFGAENICRELVRRAGARGADVVLRGAVAARSVANAEELTVHAMSSGVTLIMVQAASAGQTPPTKVLPSLRGSLEFLESGLDSALAHLPSERRTSYLELALYCLLRHLEFRQILDPRPYARLGAFAARFDERASARATPYRFDAPAAPAKAD